MARFCGIVGFVYDEESVPGVFVQKPIERTYYGDAQTIRHDWQQTDTLNDNLNVGHRISVIADEFAYGHFSAMRYVRWMGTNWRIRSAEVQRPRIILTLGGVYNGITPESAQDFESNLS